MTGKTVDGQTVREASGNVYLVHGNINVYCNTAIQYIDLNKVELIGDVKIYQDTLSLFAPKAIYYGNEGKAVCDNGVTLKDPVATVKANNGIYFFNESKAIFNGNVIVTNPTYKITSNKLTYLRNTEDSFARENVVVTTDSAIIRAENIDFYKRQGKTYAFQNVTIESDSSIINSDTLTNYSFEKKSIAVSNVKLNNLRNNVLVYGDYLENYEKTKYSFLRGNSKLVQVENKTDTMFIYSKTMEAFRQTPEKYIAKDSVEIIRKDFLSRSRKGVYSKSLDTAFSSMQLTGEPIVWQDNLQITSDSILAELKNKKIKTVYCIKLDSLVNSKISFLIIQNKDTSISTRNDQVSGKDIIIHFDYDKINYVNVNKKSNSIYFMYEENKPNGVNIADGENMIISFDNEQKVYKVRIDKDPKGRYVPENKIGNENLYLPGYNLRKDKPVKR